MSGILGSFFGGIAGAVKDAYFNLTTLLLHGDGTNGAQNNTFLDSSSNNFTITRNGNTTQGTFTPFSQMGWSNYFSSSYLQTSAAALTSTASTFTIEAWIYMTQLPTTGGTPNVPCLVGDFGGASSTNYWGFGPMSNGTLQFFWYDGASKSATGNTVMAANTWNHIAISVNASSITMYVNGVQQTLTGNTTLTNRSGSLGYTTIGQYNTTTGVFYGYVSNLRITTTAVYSTGFTPSTAPLTAITGTTLLTCQDNRFKDNSTNNYTLTVSGSPSVQAFSPFAPTAAYSAATNGGAGYFDGAGDYIVAPSNAAFGFGTGDATIEAMIYPTTVSGTQVFLDTRVSTSAGIGFYLSGSTLSVAKDSATVLMQGGTVIPNAWNHVVWSRVGTTNRLFLNGTQTTSATDSTNYPTAKCNVGANDTGAQPFAGYISSLRVIKGSGVTSVTVPTAPLTAITNTQLLLNFTNGAIFDQTGKNVLETVGTAQISTTQKKFGTGSLYINGSGNYLFGASGSVTNNQMQVGSGNFTIEFWLYTGSFGSSTQCPFFFGSGTTNAAGSLEFGLGTSGLMAATVYIGGGGYGIASSTAMSTNTWTHFALVRTGGTLTLYQNGTNVASRTDLSTGSANWNSSMNLYVGSNYGGLLPLTGYIDELRVTKYARYNANFTPPTAAFPDQ